MPIRHFTEESREFGVPAERTKIARDSRDVSSEFRRASEFYREAVKREPG